MHIRSLSTCMYTNYRRNDSQWIEMKTTLIYADEDERGPESVGCRWTVCAHANTHAHTHDARTHAVETRIIIYSSSRLNNRPRTPPLFVDKCDRPNTSWGIPKRVLRVRARARARPRFASIVNTVLHSSPVNVIRTR